MLKPPLPASDLLNVDQVHALLGGTWCETEIYRNFNIGRKRLSPGRTRWSKKAILKWLEDLEYQEG